ncbi:MAG: hypothetical protein KC431_32050, partial [Myxococcales bacterium]|nr:hypothetical protein [Myxococcales bacterium]
LLDWLRRHGEVFGLDPPRGQARFLARHGEAGRDRAAVFAAQGATDLDAGFEAKAVLARWGDAGARRELEAALDYAPVFAAAAHEAWFAVYGGSDWDRLSAGRDDPALADRTWSILCTAEPDWLAELTRTLERVPVPEREAWARFIVDRLRRQLPAAFVVGAISADHGVLARLLPAAFSTLVQECLGPAATPDRLSVDLLAWLGEHRPMQGLALARAHLDSPHWGLRQAAEMTLSKAGAGAIG